MVVFSDDDAPLLSQDLRNIVPRMEGSVFVTSFRQSPIRLLPESRTNFQANSTELQAAGLRSSPASLPLSVFPIARDEDESTIFDAHVNPARDRSGNGRVADFAEPALRRLRLISQGARVPHVSGSVGAVDESMQDAFVRGSDSVGTLPVNEHLKTETHLWTFLGFQPNIAGKACHHTSTHNIVLPTTVGRREGGGGRIGLFESNWPETNCPQSNGPKLSTHPLCTHHTHRLFTHTNFVYTRTLSVHTRTLCAHTPFLKPSGFYTTAKRVFEVPGQRVHE